MNDWTLEYPFYFNVKIRMIICKVINKIQYPAIIKELFSYCSKQVSKNHDKVFNGTKFKTFLLNSGASQRYLQGN